MLASIVNQSSSRKRRREAVLALYLLLVLWNAWPFMFYLVGTNEEGEIPPLPFLLILGISFGALVAFWAIYSTLKASIQQIADLKDSGIDERQRTVRDHAYRSAYQIVATALACVLLYGYIASDYGWWLPPAERAFQTLWLAAFMLTFTLPTAIIAWNEPDPAEEEDRI